jgi:tetratricopeptide (TPR) repeat protein
VLTRLRRLGEAIAAFEKVLTIAPDHGRAHFNLGLAYKYEYAFSEAQRHFEISLNLDPGHALAMIELGGCLQRANKVDEAYAYYGQAYRIDNSNFNGIVKKMTSIQHGRFSTNFSKVRQMLETAGD